MEYPKGILHTLAQRALALKLSEKLVKAGTPVSAVDVIIAAVAISRKMALLHIKSIAPELQLELVEWGDNISFRV